MPETRDIDLPDHKLHQKVKGYFRTTIREQKGQMKHARARVTMGGNKRKSE